jgi:di/tricarboxylate transporter
LSWEAWFTLGIIAVAVVLLAREVTVPAAVVFGATVVLMVADVITPTQAFSGFSNPAPITVAALYVLAGAVERTGILAPLVHGFLGRGGGDRRALTRIVIPAAGASAFLNNTPIVAMLVPAISRWAENNGRPASRFLMPLSFAAILGGMVTVIGTSTNIVVSGLLEAHGLEAMGFFEIGELGLPITALGLVALVALAPTMLPNRLPAHEEIMGDVREFVVRMTVSTGGPLDGDTVGSGGLRHLAGVYLVQIERHGRIIAPVGPSTYIQGEDRLTFVGRSSEVVDLQQLRGLTLDAGEDVTVFDTDRLAFFEAVVGAASPLPGRTLKEIGFRSRYQAAVVAVHRAGQRVAGKLGEVPLRVGDTLLLIAGDGFRVRWRDRSDFLLVSRLGESAPVRTSKAPIATAVALAVVAVAATGLLDILDAALIGAVAVVVLGVLTPTEAVGSLNANVLVVIASAFGIGAAVEETGLAMEIADLVTDGFAGLGSWAVLLGLVLATMVLTEWVTNNAAAVLMFPIVLSAAETLDADPRALAIAMAVAASASFLTPVGYQTNTMVWGPGGYRFGDYARLGWVLSIITVVGIVALTPVFWTL